jgi:hypothetical protein
MKPDNTYRPVLTGWRLWLRCTMLGVEGQPLTYRDPAFPACPGPESPQSRDAWCHAAASASCA